MGRSPILQPPRSGMKASPIAWIKGPQSRIGMRESPACASMAVWEAVFALVGSRVRSP